MIKRITQEEKMTIQLLLGIAVVVAGLVLLFLGFYAVPIGEIAPSVLTAFGEVATFSGALIGIDYSYKFKMFKERKDKKDEIND